MNYVSCADAGEKDLIDMTSLAQRFPTENLHCIDFPFRFSSWVFDDPDNPSGQIEPLGVNEAFRGMGVGRVLLAEAFPRRFAFGASIVFVETDNDRDSALALYHTLGFRLYDEVLLFRKDYPYDAA